LRRTAVIILVTLMLAVTMLAGCTDEKDNKDNDGDDGNDDGGKNLQPHASFWFPRSVYVDEVVTFDASNSTDPEDMIERYTWNFGDGSNGSGMIVQHSYNRSGYYVIGLTVEDAGGRIDTEHDSITVSEREVVDPALQAPMAVLLCRKIDTIPGREKYVVTVMNVTGENTGIGLINYTLLDGMDFSILHNGTLVNASEDRDGPVVYTTMDDVLSDGDFFTISPEMISGLKDGDVFRLDFGPTGDAVGACLLMNPEG